MDSKALHRKNGK